jgi:hypothetical protein
VGLPVKRALNARSLTALHLYRDDGSDFRSPRSLLQTGQMHNHLRRLPPQVLDSLARKDRRCTLVAVAGGRLAAAEDTNIMMKKAKQKNPKRGAKKNTAKAKLSTKRKAPKRKAARTARRKPARRRQVVLGGQSAADTVQLKPRARTAASGAGGGDFGGVSTVEDVDSESADELLEEGQTFEAGIVSGVENARDPDQGEVRTREVLEDDVPKEYDDKDR